MTRIRLFNAAGKYVMSVDVPETHTRPATIQCGKLIFALSPDGVYREAFNYYAVVVVHETGVAPLPLGITGGVVLRDPFLEAGVEPSQHFTPQARNRQQQGHE